MNGWLSWQPGFLQHGPPQVLTVPCRFRGWPPPAQARGRVQAGNRHLWRPMASLLFEWSEKSLHTCKISNSGEDGNKLSWLSPCLVSGVPDLRNDCETLAMVLCFSGFNFLHCWSGTGLESTWGFLLGLGGVERGMPSQEGTYQKVHIVSGSSPSVILISPFLGSRKWTSRRAGAEVKVKNHSLQKGNTSDNFHAVIQAD